MKKIAGIAAISTVAGSGAKAAQPHMENALANLDTALAQLKLAVADKGGHRAKAIDLVKQAVGEVQAGINFAKGK